MSRSYKKNPITKDNKRNSKRAKRLANKKVRRNIKKVAIKGKSYKKIYSTWDIHDYVCRWDKECALKDYENEITDAKRLNIFLDGYGWHKKYKTENDFLNKFWKKSIMRK